MRKLGVVTLMLLIVMAMTVPGAVAAPHREQVTTPNWKYTFSVVFAGNRVPAEFESQVMALGGLVCETVPEIGYAQVRASKGDLLVQLQQLPGVQAIGPAITWRLPDGQRTELIEETVKTRGTPITKDSVNTASADLYSMYQWDIKRVTQNGKSYELGTGSHDVVVAVIDTGIDSDHPALSRNLIEGSKNFVPSVDEQGNEFVDETAFEDLNGHGTHVAGSIAGNGRIMGVAPDAAVRAYRVLDAGGSGYTHWIVKGIIAAVDDGCDVISMSLGGIDIIGQYYWTDPETGIEYKLGNDVADLLLYQRAVQYAASKGSIVVASAGNNALNCTVKSGVTDFFNAEYGVYGYRAVGAGFKVPAVIPGVVTVSATGPEGYLASYSNYGPGYIDIAAPGGDFQRYGVDPDWYTDMCLSSYKGGRYAWMAGTSMAAPKVSAVAALLVDEYGDQLTPSQITHLLNRQGVDKTSGTDRAFFGYGHVNAFKALGGQP